MDTDELMAGGDLVPPGTSEEVRDFIAKCRRLVYSDQFTPIIQKAITAGGDLVTGVAPVVAQIISRAEDKSGPLEDADLQTVALALSATMASTAHMLGDPDAQDIASTAQQIAEQVIEILGATQEAGPAGEPPMSQAQSEPEESGALQSL